MLFSEDQVNISYSLDHSSAACGMLPCVNYFHVGIHMLTTLTKYIATRVKTLLVLAICQSLIIKYMADLAGVEMSMSRSFSLGSCVECC